MDRVNFVGPLILPWKSLTRGSAAPAGTRRIMLPPSHVLYVEDLSRARSNL